MATYDRYSQFRCDGSIKLVPFGEVPKKNTDFYEKYERNKSRLDIISYNYYGDPNYGWLIMQANPEYGSLEYEIPNGVMLRIPFPLNESIDDYRKSIETYNKLY
jgi:hypothetical protein